MKPFETIGNRIIIIKLIHKQNGSTVMVEPFVFVYVVIKKKEIESKCLQIDAFCYII